MSLCPINVAQLELAEAPLDTCVYVCMPDFPYIAVVEAKHEQNPPEDGGPGVLLLMLDPESEFMQSSQAKDTISGRHREAAFVARPSGDGECFAFEVDDKTAQAFGEHGHRLLYPGTILRSLGVSPDRTDQKYRVTIRVEELPPEPQEPAGAVASPA